VAVFVCPSTAATVASGTPCLCSSATVATLDRQVYATIPANSGRFFPWLRNRLRAALPVHGFPCELRNSGPSGRNATNSRASGLRSTTRGLPDFSAVSAAVARATSRGGCR
jgi:hypothetical protein